MKPTFLLFAITFFSFQTFAQNIMADLVVINANVRTMDAKQPKAKSLAVLGNKIIAVGSNTDTKPLVGKNTRVIDAKGRLVLPGFNDSHVHFMGIGNKFFSIDLRDAKTPQEAVEQIKFYVKFLPKGSWILGGGWNHDNWTPKELPTRELIDAATPEHPVFIYNSDARMALANSFALKLAEIDKNRKDFQDEINRDKNGEPTGILKDRAINLVRNFIPKLSTKNLPAVAETAGNYAASLGVTSVQDMHSDDNLEIFRELTRQGKLKTRIYDCSPLRDRKKLQGVGVQRANSDAMLRGGCLKHFSDDDYDPALYEDILAADKANLQVMIHAIGSQANDVVLTIFERAAKINGAKDRRFRIEHAHNVRPEDLKRFGNSKIIPSMQPHLFYGGEPYRDLLNSGAVVAFGSDASITDFNPLYGIHAAVNYGEQAISVEEAVRAYTVGSAYAEFQENVKGTISVGKLADMVILSDDIFSINPNRIREMKVLTTIMDGKIVYQFK